MEGNPLSGFAASPFSRASRGKGDAPSAAGRPLRGSPDLGRAIIKAAP
ncbi:hypothetical protein C8D04_1687 [Simplicispira sp. 125]|nr:hypothetical protein C8D04_1687 [Simplicispira sp. 125]REG17376.1 hypothetical protein C8D01_1997 [Simplicispira sp. 110]